MSHQEAEVGRPGEVETAGALLTLLGGLAAVGGVLQVLGGEFDLESFPFGGPILAADPWQGAALIVVSAATIAAGVMVLGVRPAGWAFGRLMARIQALLGLTAAVAALISGGLIFSVGGLAFLAAGAFASSRLTRNRGPFQQAGIPSPAQQAAMRPPEVRAGVEPLLRLVGIKKYFPITRGILFQRRVGNVHAVDGIDLDVYPGETIGLVGETGCGKSTTGRLITKLLDATEGQVWIEGRNITGFTRGQMRALRGEISMIFQDPYASLNPRKTVGSIIGEPMQIHGIPGREQLTPRFGWLVKWVPLVLLSLGVAIWLVDTISQQIVVRGTITLGLLALALITTVLGRVLIRPARLRRNRVVKEEVQRLMELVGLNPEHYNRFPHEFSGGQRQRIGVARALALRPRLIVCDEPVSALDVSIQAQILNLLEDLQEEFNLTYVFIAHDLSVVKHMSDRVAVMYLGRVVEIAPGETLYQNPKHPYTGALLSAVPIPDPNLAAKRQRVILEGDVPSPIDPPSGCRFHPRCPRAQFPVCKEDDPALTPHHKGQLAACHFPLEDRAVVESSA